MPGPLGLTAWPGTKWGTDGICRWQGSASPKAIQDSVYLGSVMNQIPLQTSAPCSVEEPCPLQEWGPFPASPV